jgi:hypothetical protein
VFLTKMPHIDTRRMTASGSPHEVNAARSCAGGQRVSPRATPPTAGEAPESARRKARLREVLLERELLEAKIAALEARDPGPLPRG